jgi:hypothetical protein
MIILYLSTRFKGTARLVARAIPNIRKEIQSRFLFYLKGIDELVGKGPQENVYHMNFELFLGDFT